MEGYEIIAAGGGAAVMLAFINAMRGAYKDWQVQRMSQGYGPGTAPGFNAHPLSRNDGRRSPLDISGRD